MKKAVQCNIIDNGGSLAILRWTLMGDGGMIIVGVFVRGIL